MNLLIKKEKGSRGETLFNFALARVPFRVDLGEKRKSLDTVQPLKTLRLVRDRDRLRVQQYERWRLRLRPQKSLVTLASTCSKSYDIGAVATQGAEKPVL